MHLERGGHLRREVPACGSECGRWRGRQGTPATRWAFTSAVITGHAFKATRSIAVVLSQRGLVCSFIRDASTSKGAVMEVGTPELCRAVPWGTPPDPWVAVRVALSGRWSVPFPGTCAVHTLPWPCGPRLGPPLERYRLTVSQGHQRHIGLGAPCRAPGIPTGGWAPGDGSGFPEPRLVAR